MSFKVKWIVKRKKERNIKVKERHDLLNAFSKSRKYNKLNELTKLYLDCHDLMTRIGEEIAEIVENK